MDIAWTQDGQKEIPGATANPEIVRYFAECGHPEVASDEIAWCAAFVGACLERAGIRSMRTLSARSYLTFGTSIDIPRVGAIAIFSRPPNSAHGHVGFVVGTTEKTIAVLGGNQADSVSVAHFPKVRLLGLRWPGSMKTATDLAAEGSRTVVSTMTQVKTQAGAAIATVTTIASTQVPSTDTITKVANKANEVKSAAEIVIGFGQFLAGKWAWIGGALALYFCGKCAWEAYQIRRFRVDDANTGVHAGKGPADAGHGAEPLIQ